MRSSRIAISRRSVPAGPLCIAGQLEHHPSRHSLGSVLYIEFAQDFLDMVLYRERTDTKDLSDLVVALALLHPGQDFDLACGQNLLGRQRGGQSFLPSGLAIG